jgi:branched-chain amino acid transport system permease protein
VRALMQNGDAAQLCGVSVDRTARLAFGAGVALAGAAGGLLAMLYSFSPDFGAPFLLRSFVIIVLGGLESFAGVAAGALLLALLETGSLYLLPASYQPAVAFGVLVVALVLLPDGISGLWRRQRGLA